MLKSIGLVIFAVVLLVLVIVGIQEVDLRMQAHYNPQYEAVRRNTFEQSKAYNQGTIQELQNMQFEYVQADKGHKHALASLILHRAADYDENSLPPDLRQFIDSLKAEYGN